MADPIPRAAEIPAREIDPIIGQAIAEAEARRLPGKRLSPFLLARIFELTSGRSRAADIALALGNATLSAFIARELARLRSDRG